MNSNGNQTSTNENNTLEPNNTEQQDNNNYSSLNTDSDDESNSAESIKSQQSNTSGASDTQDTEVINPPRPINKKLAPKWQVFFNAALKEKKKNNAKTKVTKTNPQHLH
jgi:hypothetical protein